MIDQDATSQLESCFMAKTPQLMKKGNIKKSLMAEPVEAKKAQVIIKEISLISMKRANIIAISLD